MRFVDDTCCTWFAFLQAVELFLRDRLHGEGDTMRSLASKGFRLSYYQDPRMEYNFGVDNLAVDLRNGLRLSKLVQLLTGTKTVVAAPKLLTLALLYV